MNWSTVLSVSLFEFFMVFWLLKLMIWLRDAFGMRSADESFGLYCKVTTFADGNHTLAYVGEFFLRKSINSAPFTCAPRIGKSMGTMGWCMSFDTCESKSCTHSVPFPRFGIFGTVVLLILYFISCCRFLFKLLIISLLEGRGCVPVPVVPVVPINVWSLRFLFFLYITI